jgi:hypothetical protein
MPRVVPEPGPGGRRRLLGLDLDAFRWGDRHGDDEVGDYRSSVQSSP